MAQEYFKFNLEELERYRNVGKNESEWINENIKEIDYLYLKVWDRSKKKTLRGLSRILDFYMDYEDLDMSGDFLIVRQIVMNEMLLEDINRKLGDMIQEMDSEEFDPKRYSESVKLTGSLQARIDRMVASLGTSRGYRRKDTRETAKVFPNLDMRRIEELKERMKERASLVEEMEEKVKSVEDKGIGRN